jgi:hypothetical protein
MYHYPNLSLRVLTTTITCRFIFTPVSFLVFRFALFMCFYPIPTSPRSGFRPRPPKRSFIVSFSLLPSDLHCPHTHIARLRWILLMMQVLFICMHMTVQLKDVFSQGQLSRAAALLRPKSTTVEKERSKVNVHFLTLHGFYDLTIVTKSHTNGQIIFSGSYLHSGCFETLLLPFQLLPFQHSSCLLCTAVSLPGFLLHIRT